MGFHTFDPGRAEQLEDEGRFRWCSAEELLWLLSPSERASVADLGSGTGFYTDVVARAAETVHAVDIQTEMHELYREKGVPANVDLVEAEVADLPFEDGALDAAFSTMTYHEFSGADAVGEIARVLRPGGRLVTVDWSRHGTGASGPPLTERHGLGHHITELQDAGFTVGHAARRTETFLTLARR